MYPYWQPASGRFAGKNCVTRKQPKLCKQFQGSWYLDPGNPGTAEYLSQIAKEIVSHYDVDGIHLDYIRYPEQGEKFPDQDTYRKYGKKQDLKQWRRNNITHIVRRIYTEVKKLKPWVKVSSSPIGKFNDTRRYSSFGWNAYSTVYQDAQKWLDEGIQDALFPMMYFKGTILSFCTRLAGKQERTLGRSRAGHLFSSPQRTRLETG